VTAGLKHFKDAGHLPRRGGKPKLQSTNDSVQVGFLAVGTLINDGFGTVAAIIREDEFDLATADPAGSISLLHGNSAPILASMPRLAKLGDRAKESRF
jgi:hypothetical protein